MDHSQMVALIRDGLREASREGVPKGERWADLGAGAGNFTRALRALLPPASTIYAVERDAEALARLRRAVTKIEPGAEILPVQADFTRPLDLPPLDGVLMANSLHFNRDQPQVLERVVGYLRPGGRLVLVEYDLHVPRPWVPFPVPFTRFASLAVEVGLSHPKLIGRRPPSWTGRVMYGAVALTAGK